MNYQRELDNLLELQNKNNIRPKLLLHSCCAPCSSYVLEYLSNYFEITIFYYNPNIYPAEEYSKRVEEQQTLIKEMPLKSKVEFMEGKYQPEEFYHIVKGLEKEVEGGNRCFACYELRLREAAKVAIEHGFDYYTTTLSISPYKNAQKLNEIGEKIGNEYGVSHLPSDFKKNNGYKRSIELSREYNLYRQDYCGCIYSKIAREEIKEKEDHKGIRIE